MGVTGTLRDGRSRALCIVLWSVVCLGGVFAVPERIRHPFLTSSACRTRERGRAAHETQPQASPMRPRRGQAAPASEAPDQPHLKPLTRRDRRPSVRTGHAKRRLRPRRAPAGAEEGALPRERAPLVTCTLPRRLPARNPNPASVRPECRAGLSRPRNAPPPARSRLRGRSPASIRPMKPFDGISLLRSGMLQPRCGRRNRRSSTVPRSRRRQLGEPRSPRPGQSGGPCCPG